MGKRMVGGGMEKDIGCNGHVMMVCYVHTYIYTVVRIILDDTIYSTRRINSRKKDILTEDS